MSYAQKDKSISDGAPIEGYEFIADHKTWRFTSYPTSVTIAGQVFEPAPITRTTLEIGNVVNSITTMDFNVPSDSELAKTFCYMISPKRLSVKVYRVHEGDDFSVDYKVEYTGEMAAASATGKWGIIQTASKLQTDLNGNLSSVYYQRTCNHVLFDERCKVNRAAYTQTAVVLLVQSQLVTVDDTHFADNELISGIARNTRTGEEQGIISNAGQLVRIGFPFFDIIIGDTIELTQGCDHQRLGHCKNRYNNVANYGGFDFVPEKNPFEQLNYEAVTSTTTRVRTEQEEKLSIPAESGTSS